MLVIIESPYKGKIKQNLSYAKKCMFDSFNWYRHADLMAVYIDKGISDGMKKGIEVAEKLGIEMVYRTINGNNNKGKNNVKSI